MCAFYIIFEVILKAEVKLVIKSHPTLCNSTDYSSPDSSVHGTHQDREYWNGLPFPSPGDFLDPGIEPMSPALQADSLPTEPPGKPS